jgi:uncharacterized protein (TIGR02186 family)
MRTTFRELNAVILLGFGLLTLVATSSARADDSLVTGISSHLISVTSDFTGTELLLYGAVKSKIPTATTSHGDIIVVVRGPEADLLVRKKERVAGIWINTKTVEVLKVPGFYSISSNRPLDEITDPATLNRLRIGSERLNLDSDGNLEDIPPFKEAVIRQRKANDLFSTQDSSVKFLGNNLFRAFVYFPANVPVGNYISEVYLFEDGELLSAQTSPLFISKSGLGRQIYDFAQNYPSLHGIAAILIALFAGWVASALFRKD